MSASSPPSAGSDRRAYVLDLLRALEEAVPPPPLCHHALTRARYGSDAAGWSERLALQVNVNGVFLCFFLDPSDLDAPPADLARVIAGLALDPPPPGTQFGVALGQYVKADPGE